VDKRPALEYTGQTTPEILACSDTHTHLSILFAFEWGLQAKARVLGGEDKLHDEERLVLAVLALNREVGNGGYQQFFFNSSQRFVPSIVECLRRIGCEDTASVTERAIAALGLTAVDVHALRGAIAKEDSARNAVLGICDRDFYRLTELFDKLFAFVVAEQENIQLTRTQDYPRLPTRVEASAAMTLRNSLMFWKRGWNPTLDEAQGIARRIAQVKSIPATDADIEGAAVLYCFGQARRSGDLDPGLVLADRAFELMRNEVVHEVEHKAWVEVLIAQCQLEKADQATLDYLTFLNAGGRADYSEEGTGKSVMFWARLVKEHRAALPRSASFFELHFLDVKLDAVKLLPKLNLKFPKPKAPIQFLSERAEYTPENG
jgi:Domain of unknown function (DUF4375)